MSKSPSTLKINNASTLCILDDNISFAEKLSRHLGYEIYILPSKDYHTDINSPSHLAKRICEISRQNSNVILFINLDGKSSNEWRQNCFGANILFSLRKTIPLLAPSVNIKYVVYSFQTVKNIVYKNPKSLPIISPGVFYMQLPNDFRIILDNIDDDTLFQLREKILLRELETLCLCGGHSLAEYLDKFRNWSFPEVFHINIAKRVKVNSNDAANFNWLLKANRHKLDEFLEKIEIFATADAEIENTLLREIVNCCTEIKAFLVLLLQGKITKFADSMLQYNLFLNSYGKLQNLVNDFEIKLQNERGRE